MGVISRQLAVSSWQLAVGKIKERGLLLSLLTTNNKPLTKS